MLEFLLMYDPAEVPDHLDAFLVNDPASTMSDKSFTVHVWEGTTAARIEYLQRCKPGSKEHPDYERVMRQLKDAYPETYFTVQFDYTPAQMERWTRERKWSYRRWEESSSMPESVTAKHTNGTETAITKDDYRAYRADYHRCKGYVAKNQILVEPEGEQPTHNNDHTSLMEVYEFLWLKDVNYVTAYLEKWGDQYAEKGEHLTTWMGHILGTVMDITVSFNRYGNNKPRTMPKFPQMTSWRDRTYVYATMIDGHLYGGWATGGKQFVNLKRRKVAE